MKIGELFVEIGAKLDKFNKGMSDVQKSMQNIGRKLSAVGKQLTMKVTLPIVALGAVSVKAFADFDKSMTESTAIMGKLSDSVKKDMADLAKTISTKTTFSAKELAAAYFYLASAGMDAQQSMKALGEVARFAQAGAFDLSTATDLLTDAQTALGLSSKDAAKNQRNLVKVSDVLVKANTLANASVQQFAEALTSKAAASLVNVNKEMEEGVAVLAAYADKGIKGTLAGERLTMMLNGLFAATQQNKKAWDDVGISLFDANGAMRGMGDIIGDLEVLLGNMTTEQKQATLAQLGFNVRTKDSILALMGSSEKIKQWTRDLKKAGGITKEVSDKQLESFSNKMKILKNRLNLVAVELGEKLAPIIEKIAKKIEKATEWFSNLSEGTKETIIQVGLLFAALGPVLSILGKILIVVPKLAKAFKFLATSPMGLVITGLALITVEAIKAKKEFEKSMKLYQKEMDATGKKTSWFTRTWGSLSTAIEKTTTRLDINRIAMQGYNEAQRKAQGVMSIVKGTAWALSDGVKFLGEKWQALVDILPKVEKEEASVNESIKTTVELIETELRQGLVATGKQFGLFTGKVIDATEVLDALKEKGKKAVKEIADALTELAIPAARNFGGAFKEITDGIVIKVKEVKSVWEDVSQRMKDLWADNLGDMLLGAKSFKDALGAVWSGIKKMFADMVAKMVVTWVFDGVGNLVKGATKAAGGISSSFKSVGKAVSGIGEGIGKLIVSLAKGIAKAAEIIAASAPAILIAAGVALAIYAGFKAIGSLFKGGTKPGSEKDFLRKITEATTSVRDMLRGDYKVEFHIIQNSLIESQKHLFAIQARADRRNELLTNMEGYLQKIRDYTEPLSKIKFAASGISETVSSPTMYMAGVRGTERVNISPVGQADFQPNLSIESTPVNIYLDSEKVGLGVIKHFPKFSKGGQMHIHTRASKRF